MERSCAIMSNSQIIGDALRDALEHVTLSDLNHEMAHHERKHDQELVASIKPADKRCGSSEMSSTVNQINDLTQQEYK